MGKIKKSTKGDRPQLYFFCIFAADNVERFEEPGFLTACNHTKKC